MHCNITKIIVFYTVLCLAVTSCAQQRYQTFVQKKSEYYSNLAIEYKKAEPNIDAECSTVRNATRETVLAIVSCQNEKSHDFLSNYDFPHNEIFEIYFSQRIEMAESYQDKKISKKVLLIQNEKLAKELNKSFEAANQQELDNQREGYQSTQKIVEGIATVALIALVVVAASKGGNGGSGTNHQGCCSYHQGISNFCSADGRIVCNDGQVSPSCPC